MFRIAKLVKLFFKITSFVSIIFSFTIYSNQDFFLKIGDSQDLRKINLEAQSLKIFEENIKNTGQKHQAIPDFAKASSGGHNLTLTTNSDIKVPATFYDRGSDAIIIAGQALPACKESMKIYANLFSSYDVILFDYRWNGKYLTSLLKSILMGCPIRKILLDEIEEIRSVLRFVNKHKKYTKIIGLGECYSNFLFAKIQADDTNKYSNGPFTHLIFDSCWHSLRLFAESICADPFLPISPQLGGAPWILKKITNNGLVKYLFLSCFFGIMNNISIDSYLSELNIPVLFIHGLKDLFVPQKHFEKIWQATPPKLRAVFFTPYSHCDNLESKLLYRFIVELFIKSSSIKKFQSKCAEICKLL